METHNQEQTTSSAQQTFQDSRNKMLSGSAWMTAGSIMSRILGAIYVIPWVTWFGAYSTQANALFAKGYNLYSMFLTIATAGIPSAMSKLVGHYNGLDQYIVSKRVYHAGMYVSAAMGVICAIIMAFGANILADGDANVVPVVRSLAWAVLIIPPMSITRGFLQGYNWMAPSAMSQFIEQLFRVIYMLVATFLIMKIQKGSWVVAVTQSTFAAFIGALGAIMVLTYSYMRHSREMKQLEREGNNNRDISSFDLIVKIIYQSIPFIIVESGIVIYQLIDQYTFNRIMHWFGNYTNYQLNAVYALFSFNANKLYMIIISFATALAVTAIPLLATARAQRDQESMRRQIENALMMFYFVMIPATLGVEAVASQLYTVFYRYDAAGITVLQFATFVSIPMGMYTVVAAMMQGISENRRMIKYLFIGVVVKFILQVPCIWLLEGLGPLLATGLSMFGLNYLVIHSFNMEFGLHFNDMAKATNQILAYSLIMFVGVKALMMLFGLFISPYARHAAFFTLVVGVAFGVAIFTYLALRYRLADSILGAPLDSLRQRLHMHN
ncbi:putative polysaccharide biosynthesis protein [Limosilactobacillus secaliphilus]|uniref:Polysaccharide biosynthesis protein n=1 Tax=Limosilactobacillus secaliphilus TaxID=396268 RepID=A0A0R2I1U8_9LACO|nr:polysaccharide biosynthesis protein [Limosilactobacillus secaliphilus]KRN59199.1 polysaccharide biosynthesis protein [Limosilactobacillus secaliphilus]